MKNSYALFATALVAAAGSARAGTITLNFDPNLVAGTAGNVMDARYRFSNTNWDQVISTSANVSGSTIVQQANLGNHNQLNGTAWDFSLSYSAAGGWTYTLSNPNGGSPIVTSSTLSWNSTFNGAAFDRSYNSLELFAVIGSLPSGVTAASMAATDLSFTSAGNTVVGSLSDIVSTSGLVRSWIYADFDLATTSWTLSGKLRGDFTGSTGSNLDERIKFDVKAGTITVVPSPGSVALLGLGALVATRRRR